MQILPDPGNVNTPVVVSLTKKSSPIKPKFDEKEVKAMSSKKYMDTLVTPTLLKALTATNKQVRTYRILFPRCRPINPACIPDK